MTASAPATMSAVVMTGFGGEDVLRTAEVPVPRLRPDEVLVRVRAVAVGRSLDLQFRAGRLPFGADVPMPHVLGAEHAGTVVATGGEVGDVEVGSRVASFPVITCGACRQCRRGRTERCPDLQLVGIARWGGYAEYCAVPATNVHALPDDLTFRDACALTLNGAVAHRQLDSARPDPGAPVLVHGAGGALGSAVTALAVHRGLSVIAASRSEQKRAALSGLGVRAALDPDDPRFVESVLEASEGGVDVVVDNVVSEQTWESGLAALAPGGCVVSSGALVGGRVGWDARRAYLRSTAFLGVRTARNADVRAVLDDVRAGFRAVADERRFSVDEAPAAHGYLERSANFGRVVLTAAG